MDESDPLSLFKQQETAKAPKSHLATFPWYTTRHICTSLFPFKFPPKFCVGWWLKNVRAEAHAGMYSQLEENKTCKAEDVKVSSSLHIISILQYSYRLLLLMHMSGMTAGPPSGYLSLRQSHSFFSLCCSAAETLVKISWCPNGNLLGTETGFYMGGLLSTAADLFHNTEQLNHKSRK